MSNFIDIAGKKFGKLVAIERISDGAFGKWKFKCECGRKKTISKQNVMQGKVRSCGCLNKEAQIKNRLKLNGKRFGRLIVKSLNGIKKRNTFWDCKCDCGNEIVVHGPQLVNGHTKSCGCGRTYSFEKGDVGFNIVYKQYIRHARNYNRIFDLSKEDFRELTQKECFYCGGKPSAVQRSKSKHSEFIYNGIDRIDSKKGYVKNNVKTCCKVCNRMKWDHSLEDFKAHIGKIYSRLVKMEKEAKSGSKS